MIFAARGLRASQIPSGRPIIMQNSSAVSTSAGVTIACDHAPIAPMATSEIRGGDTHADAGDPPGDQREENNRHRRRHPQQQLLEGAENIIHRHADPPEQGTEVQHDPVDGVGNPAIERDQRFYGTDP